MDHIDMDVHKKKSQLCILTEAGELRDLHEGRGVGGPGAPDDDRGGILPGQMLADGLRTY